MGEPGLVTSALLRIHRRDIDAHGLAEQICGAFVAGLDVDGAAISLLTGTPARETLWVTDQTAQLLEDLQFGLNEGICMEAAATGRPVLVPDLRNEGAGAHWPIFAAAVADLTEVAALFVLPLQWGTVNLGVLDLYRCAPGSLSPDQLRDALDAGETASLLMLTLRTDPGDGAWLHPPIGGRAEIHQATGMVVGQLGVSPQDALARLRAYAFVEQLLLVDVAHSVVSRRLSFTEDMR